MTEQRLKEIKDSIDFQLSVCDIPEYETSKLLAEEELELYNEVVRLREIINEIEKYAGLGEMNWQDKYQDIMLSGKGLLERLNELKKSNLTLEQLTGVENE